MTVGVRRSHAPGEATGRVRQQEGSIEMQTASAVFDAGLMRRYGGEGPRYTSYPTALQFKEDIDASDYEAAAASSAGALHEDPLSVYVHIPFCYSPCFYCGCNKVVSRRLDLPHEYVNHLLKEIAMRARFFKRSRVVEQLHFGGGTPSFLANRSLIDLMSGLDEHFGLTEDAARDYSIEIDPRGTDRDALRLMAGLGFNRMSLGVQDFDPEVQSAINRVQSVDTVRRVYEEARAQGFRSINFDLIYGLPKQSAASFGATLECVTSMRPDRIAVYGYAHMPDLFKAQKRIRSEDLPDSAERLALLQLTVDTLCAAGYEYIGMDHFALPTDGLARARHEGTLHRSFQGYTTHANRDLVNLGVSAIGMVGNLYIQNYKALPQYGQAIDAGKLPAHRGVHMSDDDVLRREVIQQIMCRGILDFADIERRFKVNFAEYFASELANAAKLADDGLVIREDGRLTLTPRGRFLTRNVAMLFDAYLTRGAPRKRMSRAI